jgi:hypothetical protein
MGDFNNQQTDSPEERHFLDIFSFSIIPMGSRPHHQPHCLSSTIDSVTHFTCPEISYHDFIDASVVHSTLLPWDSIYNLADANLKVLRLTSFLVALLWFEDNVFCAMQERNRGDLNGVVVSNADCYSKGPGFESRVSHGPFQKV